MKISPYNRSILAIFLALLVLAGPTERAGAASSKKEDTANKLPLLTSFEFYQIGDTDLVANARGKSLPMPEIVHTDNQTVIVFKGTRLADSLRETRTIEAPMLTDVRIEQAEGDVMILTMTADLPLQLRSTRGVPPSDSYTLRFVTAQQQQRLESEPAVTLQPQTPRIPTGPFASNTPITLDLRDTELRDIFRMMGMHLKKNIIIDPSLPSVLVTMTLKNIPLSEAYAYLMKTYDLSYEFIGKDTIVIGTTDGLSKIAGKEETRLFRVAYADTAAMQKLLSDLVKLPADRIVADPRLRTLYVTSNGAKLEEVAIVLQKLDHPGRQVMMQARLLEITDRSAFEVETAINAVYDHWWFNYSQAGGRGGYADDNRRGRDYVPPTGTNPLIPITTTMLTPMQGVWREFDAAFRAMEEKGNARALANPSVIAIDGQEATIALTEDYPYISERDDAGNPTWTTEEVGPQMKLTPLVGRDGVISIKVDIETGEVIEMVRSSTGEEMPRTSTRKVTTNVRVRDGEPFVVGGLFRENVTHSQTRFPILGSIPLLGELFTFRHNDTTKTQVIIVVVPYILDTPDAAIEQERVMFRY
ncbi:MAG: secretion protein [Synergistaceae bacterium]|jgi:type IV pilus assembly protein PilQ|nr:secretion protein [Synergistaceae bacterium]